MTAPRHFRLANDGVRQRAATYILKEAGQDFDVVVTPPKRTDGQSAKFHALCSDLQRSGLAWAGKPRTAAQWKVLLISAHAMATKEGAEVIPGLEGEWVNVRESTTAMSRARTGSLNEYTTAFCVANNVRLTAPKRYED